MTLSEPQIRRYSRHIVLPDVGGVGQSRLLAATVALDLSEGPAAIVAATYLAAAGVGTLVLDHADPALLERLTAQNPDVQVRTTAGATYRAGATYLTAEALVEGGVKACAIIHRIVRGE